MVPPNPPGPLQSSNLAPVNPPGVADSVTPKMTPPPAPPGAGTRMVP